MREVQPSGYYRALAQCVTTAPWKYLVPLVIFGIFAAGCSQLWETKLSLSLNINLGHGPADAAYGAALGTFPAAELATPFVVVAQPTAAPQPNTAVGPTSAPSVLSQSFFAASCKAAQAVARLDGIVPQSLQGIAFAFNFTAGTIDCVSLPQAEAWLHQSPPGTESVPAALYKYQFAQLVNPANTSTLMTFGSSFGPFDDRTKALTGAIRTALSEATAGTPTSFLYYR